MNPKDLLSEETIVKKQKFLGIMGKKLRELSGIAEAKTFEDLAARTLERGIYLLPVAYLGVAASSYATSGLTFGITELANNQEVTNMIGKALTITAASIAGLGTFLDTMGAITNKVREAEENESMEHFKLNKSKVIGRMVAMSSNDPNSIEAKVKIK